MLLDPQGLARLRAGMDAGWVVKFASGLAARPNLHGYFKVVEGARIEVRQGSKLLIAVDECPACHGNAEVQFNDSPNGDPQCDDYARCPNCDDGLVIS